MATFSEALKSGISNAFCKVTAVESSLLEIFKNLSPFGRFYPNLPGFYNNLFCNKPPSRPPGFPFAGGQCSKVYLINYTSTDIPEDKDGNQIVTANVRVWGPISSFQYRDSNGVTNGKLTVTCFGSGNLSTPLPNQVELEVKSTIFAAVRNPAFSVVINSVTTFNGTPDNCGDVPTNIVPFKPGNNITVGPITYVDVGGNTVNVPVIFAFGYAKLDLNFNIKIPFTLNLNGTLNVKGELNLTTGDVNFNFGGQPGGTNNPPGDSRPGNEPGDYIPGNDPPAPTDPTPPPKPPQPDDPSTELVIRAALVVVTSLSEQRASKIFQTGGNPDIYAPNLGYINFYYRSGAFGGWSEDIPIKNTQTIIPVPWDAGAIDVKGTPGAGVTFSITPIYKRVEIPSSTPPVTT